MTEPTGARSVVTIGAFDGVHRGHRQVIAEVLRVARDGADGSGPLRSVVVTFDRHPAQVVRPESAPLLITDLDQKLELLRATGVDEVRVIPFDAERASEPAEDFVREVLVGILGARVVIVGSDFHFGNGRRGNVEMLRRMGGGLGFEVVGYGLVADDVLGGVVSSTRIRGLIASGEMGAVAELLGRPHEIRGEVLSAHRPTGYEQPGGPGREPAPVAARREGRGSGGWRLAVGVPPGIAVPRPGEYEAEVIVGQGRASGAAVVDSRPDTGSPTVLHVDIWAGDSGNGDMWAGDVLEESTGDPAAVRVMFPGRAGRAAAPEVAVSEAAALEVAAGPEVRRPGSPV